MALRMQLDYLLIFLCPPVYVGATYHVLNPMVLPLHARIGTWKVAATITRKLEAFNTNVMGVTLLLRDTISEELSFRVTNQVSLDMLIRR